MSGWKSWSSDLPSWDHLVRLKCNDIIPSISFVLLDLPDIYRKHWCWCVFYNSKLSCVAPGLSKVAYQDVKTWWASPSFPEHVLLPPRPLSFNENKLSLKKNLKGWGLVYLSQMGWFYLNRPFCSSNRCSAVALLLVRLSATFAIEYWKLNLNCGIKIINLILSNEYMQFNIWNETIKTRKSPRPTCSPPCWSFSPGGKYSCQ